MKKQFICTIPIREDITKTVYIYPDYPEKKKVESFFPAISMLANNIESGDEVSLTLIISDKESSYNNLELFMSELEEIEKNTGVPLKVNEEDKIIISLEESKDKHLEFFGKISKSYKPEHKLYIDTTYGSKVTPISTFASLIFAESAESCSIEEIIYGSFYKGQSEGKIYDLRCLFEISELLHSYAMVPGANANSIVESLIMK